MNRPVVKGTTDVSVIVRIVDSTDGTPETGVVAATAGLALYYRRDGGTRTALTAASDLAALDSAHSDGGLKHIGDGYYRVDPQDAAFASGANGVLIEGTVTGMVVIGCYVPLVDVNPYDAVRGGMTALPNANAEAAGGLYTRGTGAGQIEQPANGQINVNLHRWLTGTPNALQSGRVDSYIGATAASLAFNLTGNITGDLFGSVGSVTGAVGSVTGAVGSVTGAVGSVTGNVGGNVTGSVGSIATGGITTASFAAGAIDAAAIAANAGAEIADAVWDEAISGHLTAGSTGAALNAAGSAGDPWSTSLPGAYGAGTAGKIIGDNLNATVSSRSSHSAADVLSALGTGTWASAIPWNASWNAEVQSEAADALTAFGAATEATLTAMKGATFDTSTDSLEAIRNRGDAAWVTGGASSGCDFLGTVSKSGSTYYVSFVAVQSGAIVASGSLSSLVCAFYDEDGTDLTFSGTPAAGSNNVIYASGTLGTAITDNRPVIVKVGATIGGTPYTGVLAGVNIA